MPAGICFYFEDHDVDVWSGHDLDAWNYAAQAAGDIDRMAVINLTDQDLKTPNADMEFMVYEELDAPFRVRVDTPLNPICVQVCVPWQAPEGAVPLWDYDHKADWYLFGPARGWQALDGPCVYVPQAGRGALHAVHIASVVMLHRYSVINP